LQHLLRRHACTLRSKQAAEDFAAASAMARAAAFSGAASGPSHVAVQTARKAASEASAALGRGCGCLGAILGACPKAAGFSDFSDSGPLHLLARAQKELWANNCDEGADLTDGGNKQSEGDTLDKLLLEVPFYDPRKDDPRKDGSGGGSGCDSGGGSAGGAVLWAARALLAAGASPLAVDDKGWAPLHYAWEAAATAAEAAAVEATTTAPPVDAWADTTRASSSPAPPSSTPLPTSPLVALLEATAGRVALAGVDRRLAKHAGPGKYLALRGPHHRIPPTLRHDLLRGDR